jgi:hypothetical protein
MVRCVKCGCSRWDSEGYKCALCDGSPALRGERVHVCLSTRANLVASEEDLRRFGVTLEKIELLKKPMRIDTSPEYGLVLDVFDDPMNPEVLQELVHYLCYLGVSEEDMLRLRLAEPEEVTALCRAYEPV